MPIIGKKGSASSRIDHLKTVARRTMSDVMTGSGVSSAGCSVGWVASAGVVCDYRRVIRCGC
jgi:predicted TIM-barrel enzyme